MTDYDQLQWAMRRVVTEVALLGQLSAIMLGPTADDDEFGAVLAIGGNVVFGCD